MQPYYRVRTVPRQFPHDYEDVLKEQCNAVADPIRAGCAEMVRRAPPLPSLLLLPIGFQPLVGPEAEPRCCQNEKVFGWCGHRPAKNRLLSQLMFHQYFIIS